MKPNAAPFVLACLLAVLTGHAAVIDKTNNADVLSLGTSWVGGVVPGTNDIAQWSAVVPGAATNALGADTSWLGLKLTSPGGAITLGAGNTLTLGGSGVDMSAAAQNLTVNCSVALLNSQTWSMNGGHLLTLGGNLNAGGVALTKAGAGTLTVSGGASLQNLYVSAGKCLLTGGTVDVGGGGDNASSINGGTFEQSGGVMNSSFYTRLGSAAAGTLLVSGGSFNNSGEILFGYGGAGAGTLTVTNSGAVSAHFLRLGNNAAAIVNLDGGMVTANRIFSANGQGTFNFNGGTLRPGPNFTTPWIESGVVGTFVKNGGAVIDTAGRSVTVQPWLRAAAGSTGGLTKLGLGTLTLAGASNTYAGPTLVAVGALVINGRSTGAGLVTVQSSATLGGTGVISAAVAVQDAATLAAGPGVLTVGALTLSNSAVLNLALGSANGGTNAAVRVVGNLILDGQLFISDGGGLAPGQTLAALSYTGTLTDRGATLHPQSVWDVALDTSTPGLVKLVVVRPFPFVDFGASEMNVSTLTTNLSVLLHGTSTKTMWYETRDPAGKMWDFGAHVPSSPWPFTVRHLRDGTNTVTVFAQPVSGALQSNSLKLILNLGAEPVVRPRPVPAEIWWGGLSTNQQLLDPTRPWDFVKQFQDGVFFHSAGYGGLTDTDKQNLAALLRAFNARYWVELGGGTSTPGDAWVTFQGSTGWGAALNTQQSLGLVMSQITHDYHMENMEDVCRAHPDWPAGDLIAWWTGDLTQAGPAYPYASGLWRDVFNLYYADSPHLKTGHTSSSVYWYWANYPQLTGAPNNLLYTPLKDTSGNPIQVNGTNVSFSFNARDILLGFVRMAQSNGHPYFSFQTDFPWDYFGPWGYPTSAATNRAKIRYYERELQTNGARHTLICNVSNADGQGGGNDAQDNYYKASSLSSMTLHQAEGGRANVYLFESWYSGIPHTAAPESKPGSYANLALDAIKYLKGIRDTNGTLQPLTLTLVSTGATSVVRLQNNGDVACLPALLAFESGDASATTHYFTSNGVDITSAVLSPDGYAYTNKLAPGTFAQFTVVTTLPASATNAVSKTVSLEVFWNPQDPLGIVRDRKTITLTVAPVTFVSSSALWKYLDDGSNQGAAWRSNTFNDASWASGPAPLGYGEMNVGQWPHTTNSYGPDPTNKYITTYYRRSFFLTDPTQYRVLQGQVQRDDGVVLYLNDTEIFRSNMATGAVNYLILASTAVSGADEAAFFPFATNTSMLRAGWNVLAAEIHQAAGNSSDIIFDLELDAVTNFPPQVALLTPLPNAVLFEPPALALTASASDLDGAVTRVEYFADGAKLGESTAGAPYTFGWANPSLGDHVLTAVATDDLGAQTTSTAVPITVVGTPATLLSAGAVWKYLDTGTNLDTAWRSNTFNDAAWASGLAPLGYGEMNVGQWPRTTNSFGPDSNNKYITTYYRRILSVANAAQFSALAFRLLRDDGAVVYLNGAEVFRSNMTNGPVNYLTLASTNVNGSDEANYFLTTVSPWFLHNGDNLLAVEIHQSSAASSDIAFDLEVIATNQFATTLIAPGSVWRYNDTGANLGTIWRSNTFNDAAWVSGASQLGFGDGDEATVIASNRQVTTYFRQPFYVTNPTAFGSVTVSLLRDDGAVVYLNGAEVFRSNMPTNQAILFDTLASSSALPADETTTFYEAAVSPNLLLPGWNLLAVEVHQNNITSSDLSFDLALRGYAPRTVPALDLTRTSPFLALAWPDWAGGFVLYSTTNLTPSAATWTRATNEPVSSNGVWLVPLPAATNGARFYRLQTQ